MNTFEQVWWAWGSSVHAVGGGSHVTYHMGPPPPVNRQTRLKTLSSCLFLDNSATYNMDPLGVAVDKCGHVLVADGYKGNIVLLSNQGEYIRQLITSKEGLETPCALAVDKDDQLVITDAESEEIKVFSYLE